METCTKNPAVRQFYFRFALAMGGYVVLLVSCVLIFVRLHPGGLLVYPLAVLPALPIVGMLACFALYLREEKDDFQRAVMVQSMLWALGATLTTTTVWGFLENFAHVAHLQSMLIFPLYCFFWGLISPLVMRSYR